MSTVVFIQTTEPNDVMFIIKQHRRSAPQSKNFYVLRAAFKASTLSVFSQVNSGSSRPKCP